MEVRSESMTEEHNTKKCEFCGTENKNTDYFCSQCGKSLAPNTNTDMNNSDIHDNHVKEKNNIINSICISFIVILLIITIFVIYNQKVERDLYKETQTLYEQNDLYKAKEKVERLPVTNQEYLNLRNKINLAIYIKEGDEELKSKNYKGALLKYKTAESLCKSAVAQRIDKVNTLIQNKINQYESYMAVGYDNVENIAWYTDKAIAYNLKDSNLCYMVIGKRKSGGLIPKLTLSYYGGKYLKNQAKFNIDGETYFYTFSNNEVVEKQYFLTNSVKFYLDYRKYSSLAQKIANSQHAYVRFSAYDSDVVDREITPIEKAALKRTIKYYDYIK